MPRFAPISSGRFTMGSDEGNDDERPARLVQVDAFHVSVHAITVDQYAAFVRDTGHPAPSLRDLPLVVTSHHEPTFRELAASYVWRGTDPPPDRGRHPVTLVSHADATAYCRWLSGQIGKLVRLPTEAEWERSARGGLERKRYPWGDDIDASRGNFLPEPGLKRHRGTTEVGSYPPNGFELFDMAGNVWQWVADWYGAHTYREFEPHNPARARQRRVPAAARRIVGDARRRSVALRPSPQGPARTPTPTASGFAWSIRDERKTHHERTADDGSRSRAGDHFGVGADARGAGVDPPVVVVQGEGVVRKAPIRRSCASAPSHAPAIRKRRRRPTPRR